MSTTATETLNPQTVIAVLQDLHLQKEQTAGGLAGLQAPRLNSAEQASLALHTGYLLAQMAGIEKPEHVSELLTFHRAPTRELAQGPTGFSECSLAVDALQHEISQARTPAAQIAKDAYLISIAVEACQLSVIGYPQAREQF